VGLPQERARVQKEFGFQASAIVYRGSKTGRNVQLCGCMCQVLGRSNRPQEDADDNGSFGKEPDEVESLTSGSESGVREGIPLPTVTQPTASLAALAARRLMRVPLARPMHSSVEFGSRNRWLWRFRMFGQKLKPVPELNQVLAQLVANLPNIRRWLVLLDRNGIAKGSFPTASIIQVDRISSIACAMSVLGERVSRELSGGALHYVLVAGEDGLHLVVVLDKNNLLALGLPSGESIDSVLSALKQSVTSLLQMLKIEQVSAWLVT